MTDYQDQYNETSDKTTRQSVKQTPNEWQNPYILEGGNSPTGTEPRHRRSVRYDLLEEEVPKNGEAPLPYVEENATAPQFGVRDRRQDAPIAFENDDFMEDDDDDYEEIRIWPRVLLAVLGILLAMCIALYFVPNAGPLQPVKEMINGAVNKITSVAPRQDNTPQVLSIEANPTTVTTGSMITFRVTTNQNINNLYLVTEYGNQLDASIALTAESTDDVKVWQAAYVFNAPFNGNIIAAYHDGNGRTQTDKMVYMAVTVPTPVPTIIPTPVPTQVPTPVPTAVPTQVPTQILSLIHI